MKKWAFYKEGAEWCKIGVCAAMVAEKHEPGMWKRRTYYSTHSPPSVRLKMHIRRSSNGKLSFAYNPHQEKEISRLGGGESLVHYLYKIAISELRSTTIKVNNLKQVIDLEILSSEIEKRVFIGDKYYDLDVFCKFRSKSIYQLKWGGVLGIEIHNTNPVVGTKLADLVRVGIPLVEVDVNKYFAYRTPSEYTNPEKERKYVDYLKSKLTEYIWVRALSDPKSKEYLEKENSALISKLRNVKKELANANQKIAEHNSDFEIFEQELQTLRRRLTNKDSELKQSTETISYFKGMGLFRFAWYKVTGR